MKIKDVETGIIREYGSNQHDSLLVSDDGRTLSYYNLQCGDGSRYGSFLFVEDDGEVPGKSRSMQAVYCGECYFNIGGFDRKEVELTPIVNFIPDRKGNFRYDYDPAYTVVQCRRCNNRLRLRKKNPDNYCPKCGQKINWGKIKEQK